MLTTMFPNSTLDRLSREMDRLMRSSLAATPQRPHARSTPALNLWREGDTIVAEAELPGFQMHDIEVLVNEDVLTIRGRRESQAPEGATPLRCERSLTRFERTVRMPLALDADNAEATLKDGVLRLTLPLAEQARARRIEVKASPAALPSDSGAAEDTIVEEVN